MKIGIIGLGMVGKEILLNLFRNVMAEHIYVLDLNQDRAESEIMDLQDTTPFHLHHSFNKVSFTKDYAPLKKCNIVIINVSIPEKLTNDRLDALKDNAKLLTEIASQFKGSPDHMRFVVTSNPVDLMTQVFIKASGVSAHKVIGTGTYLDTSRLQWYLSQHYGVATGNIQTFVLAEHGNSSMIAWSLTKIAGFSLEDYSKNFGIPMVDKVKALEYVHQRAFDIVHGKGYTDHGIGCSVYNIVASIISDERRILPVSAMISNMYGINDIVLSLPCIIGANGVEKVLSVPFSPEEEKEFNKSAQILINASATLK